MLEFPGISCSAPESSQTCIRRCYNPLYGQCWSLSSCRQSPRWLLFCTLYSTKSLPPAFFFFFFNPLWSADLHPNKWSFINSGEIYPFDILQCPFNDGNKRTACDKSWREKFVLSYYYFPVTRGFTGQRYIWAPALCLIVHDAQEIQKLISDGPSLARAPRWMNSVSWHCFESLLCIRHCTCCWGNNSERQKKSLFSRQWHPRKESRQ